MGKNKNDNFDRSKPMMPQENQMVNIEDIPEECKEIIKCAKCGNTLFDQFLEWYKIKLDSGEVGYMNAVASICSTPGCGWRLPNRP